jgi:acyl carrier protein
MKQISKFRDLQDWEEARKSLQALGLDEEAIASVGEQEGDSLDLVEICIALQEAFASSLLKRPKS